MNKADMLTKICPFRSTEGLDRTCTSNCVAFIETTQMVYAKDSKGDYIYFNPSKPEHQIEAEPLLSAGYKFSSPKANCPTTLFRHEPTGQAYCDAMPKEPNS